MMKNLKKTFHSKSGMTLLEILMVTGLLSFVALSVFVSVRSMIDAKRIVDAKSESTQEFRAVLSLMSRDIQTAFFNTVKDFIWNPIPLKPEAEGLPAPQVPPPAPITIFYGKETEIFFSARSHQRLAANTPENEQHFVTYQLQEKSLVRAESARAVSIYDREDPTKFKSTILLDRVNELKFRYYDIRTANWVDSWDTESSTYRDRLPGAVEILLNIAPFVAEGETLRDNQQNMIVSTAVTITNVIMGQGEVR
jgi:type II secretory pathway pseudopilin PulG